MTARQQGPGGRGAGPDRARARRPDASMSLLTDLMSNASEEAYAQKASRGGPQGRGRSPVLVVGLAALGLLLVVAGVQVRDRAPAVAATRQKLIDEIDRRTAATDRLQRQVADLRAAVGDARQSQLRTTDAGSTAATHLARLGRVTGTAEVTGPGVRVTLDDAPAGDNVDQSGVDEGLIRDFDLQRLVNGLWAAGAEAVSVNGQRLTTLSAIRNAGDAILVDYRPLKPPYVATAIGNADRMELAFVDKPVGEYFHTLRDTYGITFDVTTAKHLRLPSASTVTLRYARPQKETP